jgi:hypothetical protein
MRVRDLRIALGELQRLFRSSGAKHQEVAIASLSGALKAHDADDLRGYLRAVEQEINADSLSDSDLYLRELRDIGLEEIAFKDLIGRLERDRKLTKSDLITIVERYTGAVDRRAPTKKLIRKLSTHFYAKLYEQDANELAKRATPV